MLSNPNLDFAVVWCYNGEANQTSFGLRSCDDRADVGKIAKSLGGGGHRNASGVTIKGCCCDLGLKKANGEYIKVMEEADIKDGYAMIKCNTLGKKFFRHPDEAFLLFLKRKLQVDTIILTDWKLDFGK